MRICASAKYWLKDLVSRGGQPPAVGPLRCRAGLQFASAFLLATLFTSPVHSQGVDVAGVGGRSIELPVGHGRILQLDEPAESVYIADTAIADLRVVAPDVIYVFGRKIGTTNLVAISAQQKVQASVQFRVVTDPRPANQAGRELAPTSPTELRLFGNRACSRQRRRALLVPLSFPPWAYGAWREHC